MLIMTSSARRFFRFFGFIESFQRVSALLSKDGMSSVPGWLDLAKWTCFGLYFLLEDLTIVSECVPKRVVFVVVCPRANTIQLHAMDVYLVPWEQRVMKEANTFWFYALSFSLAGSVFALLFSTSVEPASKAKDQKTRKNGAKAENEKVEAVTNEKADAPKTAALVRQIVVDGCDLFLPAALLGWMPTGDLVIGLTMVLSTVLTGREIWKRV